MTELVPELPEPVQRDDTPLDPWLLSLADEVTFPKSETVPREMMWARMQRQRCDTALPMYNTTVPSTPQVSAPRDRTPRDRAPRDRAPMPIVAGSSMTRTWAGKTWLSRAVGIAAILTLGIGVGRYVMPTASGVNAVVAAQSASHADSITALGLGPDALAALPYSNDPARVAMEEHLGRTVALLMTVRDDDPTYGPGADISGWARELLGTTRMLIDEPQLSDERTRRLLQDLELVLAQIIQARGSVPETQRAPSETMRETNLLPRVRAAATASRLGDDPIIGGDI